MCDYSLENELSRPAEAGENLSVHKFERGSKGLVSPGSPNVAVCMAPGIRAVIRNAPAEILALAGVTDPSAGTDVEVTFAKTVRTGNFYKDGFVLSNGQEILLQKLPEGTEVDVVALPESIPFVTGQVDGAEHAHEVPVSVHRRFAS